MVQCGQSKLGIGKINNSAMIMNRLLLLLIVLQFLFSCSSRTETVSLVETRRDTLTENGSANVFAEREQLRSSFASHSANLVPKSILGKIDVLIPDDFVVMEAAKVLVKYPSKQGAIFQVYTDKDATVNIAFEHTPNKTMLEDLPAIKQVFEQQLNQPGIDFRKSEIRKINGRDFIVLEMITPAADTRVYNQMFVTSFEGRLLISTFNCTIDKLKEWQPIAEQILSSIKVND
jgi:hypothetical protein